MMGAAQWIYTRALQRGIDSGEFRKMDVNYALRIVIAPVVLLLIWKHSLQPYERKALNVERYLETYLEILFDGICNTEKKR